MRIGILTGGGDVPGLNPAIKEVVHRASELGWEVVGFRRGWAGPLHYDPDASLEDNAEWAELLTRARVRTIDRFGGTTLHSSRTNPQRVKPGDLPTFLRSDAAGRQAAGAAEGREATGESEGATSRGSEGAAAKKAEGSGPDGGREPEVVDCTPHVLRVLESLGIDAMVPIGGDDTLSYGARLHREGVPVVAIPKTMDNDVHGTDYCIGFSTGVSRSVEHIHALRSVAGSHQRVAVIELFGRNSGESALFAGYLADADRTLIAEVPFDMERLAELVVADRESNPSRYAMVVVSEGARMVGGEVVESGEPDPYGHRKLGGIAEVVGARLRDITGLNTLVQRLAYLMRAGVPDSLDRMVAISYGNLAVQQLEAGETGVMVALRDGVYTTVPVDTAVAAKKRVDVPALYDPERYRPRIARQLGKPMFLY